MDGKDYKIIEALQEDSGAPIRTISKRMRMTESAVRKRVKQLERAGVIERYTVVVDPSKLGYNAMAVIDLDVVPEKFNVKPHYLSQLLSKAAALGLVEKSKKRYRCPVCGATFDEIKRVDNPYPVFRLPSSSAGKK